MEEFFSASKLISAMTKIHSRKRAKWLPETYLLAGTVAPYTIIYNQF